MEWRAHSAKGQEDFEENEASQHLYMKWHLQRNSSRNDDAIWQRDREIT